MNLRSICIEQLSRSKHDKKDWTNEKFSEIKKIEFSNKFVKINTIEKDCFVDFRNLEELEELDLSNNELTNVQSHYFEHLTNLKTLILKGNPITEVQSDAFDMLEKLRKFDIRGHLIKDHESLETINNLDEIALEDVEIPINEDDIST